MSTLTIRTTLAATAVALLTVTALTVNLGGVAAAAGPAPGPATGPAVATSTSPGHAAATGPPPRRRCTGVGLQWLGFGDPVLTGGDPTGRIFVGTESRQEGSGYLYKAVVWEQRVVRELDTTPLRPYTAVRPVDVNQYGVIVGNRAVDHGRRNDAWLYRDGRYILLPALHPDDSVTVTAVNARGDAVGINRTEMVDTPVYRAVLWPADRPGTVRALTVPRQEGRTTFGVDIDDDGTVLGHLDNQPGETPYIWPVDGSPYPLTPPAGSLYYSARAIRNGWVAGGGWIDQQGVTLRWDLRRGGALRQTPTQYAYGTSVNRHGTIGTIGAVVHRGGQVVPFGLNVTAVVITDDGTVGATTSHYSPGAMLFFRC